jgi:hypothetical protein
MMPWKYCCLHLPPWNEEQVETLLETSKCRYAAHMVNSDDQYKYVWTDKWLVATMAHLYHFGPGELHSEFIAIFQIFKKMLKFS